MSDDSWFGLSKWDLKLIGVSSEKVSEFFLYRDKPTDVDTPGLLVFDNEIVCFTLEDLDRGLTSEMSLKEIREIKVYGQTAIPYGRYGLVWYNSPKHGRVPLLKNVKGFSYVEIHAANWATQLLGCIAPGLKKSENMVEQSRDAMKKVKTLMLDNDIKFINIEKMK